MAQAVATREASLVIREFLEARIGELAKALPSHIRPEHFVRVALTAVSNNPDLLGVDLRSLWNALLKCAQDGLTPDGREAVLVVYGNKAGYQRMVAGIRRLVQQSGEITRFEQTIVYSNDRFAIRWGDRPHIHHEPIDLSDRGEPIAVYSVAQFKDGTLSREIMSISEIEKVRAVSRAADTGPWKTWWGEMARKTVAKRHAKILPMSSDTAAALERDNEDTAISDEAPTPLPKSLAVRGDGEGGQPRPRLAQQLPPASEEPRPSAPEIEQKRRRGRPPNPKPMPAAGAATTHGVDHLPTPDAADAPAPAPDDELDQTEPLDDEPPGPPPDPREEPSYDEPRDRIDRLLETEGAEIAPPTGAHPDWQNGWRSARNGAKNCLNPDIKGDPRRFRNWQAGYNAFLDQRAQEVGP